MTLLYRPRRHIIPTKPKGKLGSVNKCPAGLQRGQSRERCMGGSGRPLPGKNSERKSQHEEWAFSARAGIVMSVCSSKLG